MTNTSSPTYLPSGSDTPRLLTVDETCEALKISRFSFYQLVNKRRLKSVKIDRRRLVAPVDLAAFVEELRAEGGDNER